MRADVMPEFPAPVRLPGEPALPAEPYGRKRSRAPAVDELGAFGAEDTAARVAERLLHVRPTPGRPVDGGLWPAFSAERDRVDGPPFARASLVVFGAFGTPWSHELGELLAGVRDCYPATVSVAWRHFPDPAANPRATMFALAAEAAAAHGRFWVLARELLRMRHDDPIGFHAALLRAGLDPEHTLEAMRAATGADRIAEDTGSALASGAAATPTLFIDGERHRGGTDLAEISRSLDHALMREP
jgi:hypothetical protein